MQHRNRQALLVALAAGIFFGAGIFDVFPEAAKELGETRALVWMVGGLLLWWFQKLALKRFKKPDLPPLVATALWFHSILEGIVTGLAFGLSQTFGLLVLGAMVLHLLPEFFAAVALMRGAGSRNRTSVMVTLAGFAILFLSFGLTYRLLPNFGALLPIALALSSGAFAYIGSVSFWRIRGAGTGAAFLVGIVIAILFQ